MPGGQKECLVNLGITPDGTYIRINDIVHVLEPFSNECNVIWTTRKKKILGKNHKLIPKCSELLLLLFMWQIKNPFSETECRKPTWKNVIDNFLKYKHNRSWLFQFKQGLISKRHKLSNNSLRHILSGVIWCDYFCLWIAIPPRYNGHDGFVSITIFGRNWKLRKPFMFEYLGQWKASLHQKNSVRESSGIFRPDFEIFWHIEH